MKRIAIVAALFLAACAGQRAASQYPVRPTFLAVDFTDASIALLHDEDYALEWAKSDEFLVIDMVSHERIYQDGSRGPIREAK